MRLGSKYPFVNRMVDNPVFSAYSKTCGISFLKSGSPPVIATRTQPKSYAFSNIFFIFGRGKPSDGFFSLQ